MEESLRVFTSLLIAVYLFAQVSATNNLIADMQRERPNSTFIVKGSSNYYNRKKTREVSHSSGLSYVTEEDTSGVVVDADNGDLYNTYNYQQMLSSFAMQGKMMPCNHLVYKCKYITRTTAEKVSFKKIVSQLYIDRDMSDLAKVKFILLKEGKDMTWYMVDIEDDREALSSLGRDYGTGITYLYRNPDWTPRVNNNKPENEWISKFLFSTIEPGTLDVRTP